MRRQRRTKDLLASTANDKDNNWAIGNKAGGIDLNSRRIALL